MGYKSRGNYAPSSSMSQEAYDDIFKAPTPKRKYEVIEFHNKLLHRVIWQLANGTIPDGYVVHHKDHDKTNNNISNLELVEAEINIMEGSTPNTQFYIDNLRKDGKFPVCLDDVANRLQAQQAEIEERKQELLRHEELFNNKEE
jgi:hypothetical protein